MIHVLPVILLVASSSSDLLAPFSALLDDVVATYPPSWLPSDVAITDDDGDGGDCHSDDEDDAVIVGRPPRRTIRGAIKSTSTATTARDQWSSLRMWKGKGGV